MKLTVRVLLGVIGVLALQSVVLARPQPTSSHGPSHGLTHGPGHGSSHGPSHGSDRAANDLGHHGRHQHHHGQGHPRARHHFPKTSNVQLCGKELSDTLSMLCKGRGYNTMDSAPGSTSHRQGRGGLANECCHIGCTLQQLDGYCQPKRSDSQSAEADGASLEAAHQANRIRPLDVESVTDQNNTPMPTVLGGRVATKLNVTQLQKMDSSIGEDTNRGNGMVEVGTIPLPHQIPVVVMKRQQATSNAL